MLTQWCAQVAGPAGPPPKASTTHRNDALGAGHQGLQLQPVGQLLQGQGLAGHNVVGQHLDKGGLEEREGGQAEREQG